MAKSARSPHCFTATTHHSSSHPLLSYIFHRHAFFFLPEGQCYSTCHRVQQGGISLNLQPEPVRGKLSHHWLMDLTLTLASLLVQISTRRTARLLPSLNEVIPIIRRQRSTTCGMPTLFWRPLVSVIINCLSWRYLHTKRLCWQEVYVVGIGVRLWMGGWSRRWGIPVPLGRC